MCTDEYAAKLLVLTVVFISAIALLGICFLIKLGKIDEKEGEMEYNKKEESKKRLWKVFWDLFTEKCEICQKATAIYLADHGKVGDSFLVCGECGKDFENLQEIKRSSCVYPAI